MKIHHQKSIQVSLRMVIFLLLTVSVVIGGLWIYKWHSKTQNNQEFVVSQVAKRTTLGDKPTSVKQLANEDISKQELIKNQGAKAGDWLVVYQNKQKAVLWRASEGRIVAMIDTFRGDGLDLSEEVKVAILHTSSAQKQAEEMEQILVKTWPELSDKISLELTDKTFPESFAMRTKNDSAPDDIIALTDKIKLPIIDIDRIKLADVNDKATIILYVKNSDKR